MIKKINIVFSLVLGLLSINLLTICDPSIHDFTGQIPGGIGVGSGLDSLLDTKTMLSQLEDNIQFMIDSCYMDQELASAQAFSIMLSYAMFDMSINTTSLSEEQLNYKKLLYDKVRTMFMYTNTDYSNMGFEFEFFYEPITVYNDAVLALEYCNDLNNLF